MPPMNPHYWNLVAQPFWNKAMLLYFRKIPAAVDNPADEQDWKSLVRRNRHISKARTVAPDPGTELDLVMRHNIGGQGICEQTSRIPEFETTSQIQSELEAAIQLLYAIKPSLALTLIGPDGENVWKIDTNYPADKMLVAEPCAGNNYMLQAWTALTHNEYFTGKFGVFINHKHPHRPNTSSLVAEWDTINLWEASGISKSLDWQEFFDGCSGLTEFTLRSNATVASAQTYVSGDQLPSFLTVNALTGRVPSQLFPPDVYTTMMRKMEGGLIKTQLKWVCGGYQMNIEERQKLVTVFD
ncbi:hypothetical protein IWZ03DRAFT_363152 [Phyllosticta citriasiana]|uniref:Uncharacterized protein n=1 Tax=Phyllosticta citriasiana TaxID=595635 RepID=A0ABR1KCP4_9PEZI